MHLLYDARLLHRSLSGLERIQRNMLRELAARPEITRLRALVLEGRPIAEEYPRRIELIEVADTEDILRVLLDERPDHRPDILHMTWLPDRNPRDLLLPEAARATVLTFADAILYRHPEYHESLQAAAWYGRFARRLVGSCDRVIAISESAGREVVADLGCDADHVDVAYLAVDPELAVPLAAEEVGRRLARLAVAGDYFVAVGKDYPHKDHRTMLRALARLHGDVSLICAGSRVYDRCQDGDQSLDELVASLGLTTRVRWVEGLADADLKALLQGSRGLLYPSLEEGFGLPPLEAMTLGVPVAAAASMSIPEVCGAGVLLFQPGADAELCALMRKLLAGGEEVAALIARGRERAAGFSWERCVDATLESYAKALERPRRVDARQPAAERLTETLEILAHCPFKESAEILAWQERCRAAEQHAWNVEDNRDEVLRQLWELRRMLRGGERHALLVEGSRDEFMGKIDRLTTPPSVAEAEACARRMERHRDELLAEVERLRKLVPRWSLKRRLGKIRKALAPRSDR